MEVVKQHQNQLLCYPGICWGSSAKRTWVNRTSGPHFNPLQITLHGSSGSIASRQGTGRTPEMHLNLQMERTVAYGIQAGTGVVDPDQPQGVSFVKCKHKRFSLQTARFWMQAFFFELIQQGNENKGEKYPHKALCSKTQICLGFKLLFTLKTVQGASFSNKYNTLDFPQRGKKNISSIRR